MCGGSSAATDEARAARLQAEQDAAEREARIQQGQQEIDTAFSQFDQPYYDSYSRSLVDYQAPQVQDQYKTTRGKLIAALADRGILESTAGANQTSGLSAAFSDELARVENESRNAAQELQSRVENQRGDLYALNTAAADPQAISTQALGTATSLAAPSPTTAIGDLFSGFLTPYIALTTSRNNAAGAPRTSTAPVASGSGSSRVVR